MRGFTDQLQRYQYSVVSSDEAYARAAVAIVLRGQDSEAQILFIRRAEHPNDPWSGHMAFPGGRAHSDEMTHTRLAAERETWEELGFALTESAHYIGRMSDILATAKGRHIPLVITPWVYTVDAVPALVPNYEVAEALWIPLRFFTEANREHFDYEFSGHRLELPMFNYDGRKIWGLTLRMLDELLEIAEGLSEARFPSIPKDVRVL